jgi:hypothetical protein
MGTKTKAKHSVESPRVAHATDTIVDQIAKHLAEEGWKFILDDTDLHLIAHGDNGTLEVMVSCEEDAQRFFVYAYCPVTVPQTHHAELARYLVGANLPLACAKLMLSPKGRLFAEAGTPLGSDGIVDGKVFDSLFRLTLSILDDRIPDVLQIVYGGATAADVLARREQGEAPKD